MAHSQPCPIHSHGPFTAMARSTILLPDRTLTFTRTSNSYTVASLILTLADPAVADAIMNGTMTPETAAFKPKSRKAKANCDPYGNFGYGSPLGFSSASQSRPPHVTAAAADNQAQAKGGDDDASTANTLQFVAAC